MKLRPYQQAALDTLWQYLRTNEGNPAIVLPTGAGKSPLMAAIAREAVVQWGGRVGVLVHTRELVEQNHAKLRQFWPTAPAGVYAASLGRRDRFDPIVHMQIQSVHSRAHVFGPFDLLLVDEAHRIPLRAEGTYWRFIEAARAISPHLRVVGLTATPYRLQGRAVPVCGPENVLTEIVYEARIPDLIAGGYLSPLTARAGERPSLAGVRVRGGEYDENDLAAVMSSPALIERTVADMLERAEGRRAGIVFCVNVEHAQAVLARLAGERAALIHGGTPKGDREAAVAAFQSGALRWMVNVNVLSEGFDAPHIDVVAMLRPTKSPGLYYQQVGRGLRLADGKADCLVLDYAGNTLEHGAIDEIRVQRGRGASAAKVVTGKSKECPACSRVLPAGIRACECGYSFASADPAHSDRPVLAPVLSSDRARIVNSFAVTGVKYTRGPGKGGKPDHLRVTYHCGLRRFHDFVCLEHSGFAHAKAVQWWMARSGSGEVPRNVDAALAVAYELPSPTEITVDETDKYPRVTACSFAPRAVEVDSDAPGWLRSATAA